MTQRERKALNRIMAKAEEVAKKFDAAIAREDEWHTQVVAAEDAQTKAEEEVERLKMKIDGFWTTLESGDRQLGAMRWNRDVARAERGDALADNARLRAALDAVRKIKDEWSPRNPDMPRRGAVYQEGVDDICFAIDAALAATEAEKELAVLKEELATHQESEFHPDWSMLEATREALREQLAANARLRAALDAVREVKRYGWDFAADDMVPVGDGVYVRWVEIQHALAATEAEPCQECAEKERVIERGRQHVAKMQRDAVKYLVPDNDCDRAWFINRMLYHLDGPEQREVFPNLAATDGGEAETAGDLPCGCVWSTPGVFATGPACEVVDRADGGWLCSRPRGHTGEHVACSPIEHDLHRWPQSPKTEKTEQRRST
ncbi:MAG: hypothetical protein GY851_35500 [bacterium]|nr:hypothetical protein [bacterium]